MNPPSLIKMSDLIPLTPGYYVVTAGHTSDIIEIVVIDGDYFFDGFGRQFRLSDYTFHWRIDID